MLNNSNSKKENLLLCDIDILPASSVMGKMGIKNNVLIN
jgi:hypothetical protein